MIELTPGAQSRLNDYLQDLRRVLAGSPSVDPAEVERDVRDHIDAALAGQTIPIEADILDGVLNTLGSPAHWVPEAGSAWMHASPAALAAEFRAAALQVGQRLAGGPESYRLAYLSLLVLAFGACFLTSNLAGEISIVAALTSFILARASLSLFGHERLSVAQKWLLYPGLLAALIPLAATILFGPAVCAMLMLVDVSQIAERRQARLTRDLEEIRVLEQGLQDQKEWDLHPLDGAKDAVKPGRRPTIKVRGAQLDEQIASLRARRDTVRAELEKRADESSAFIPALRPAAIAGAAVSTAGLTWMLLGALMLFYPGKVRSVFYPFGERFTRASAFRLAGVGLVLAFGAVALFA